MLFKELPARTVKSGGGLKELWRTSIHQCSDSAKGLHTRALWFTLNEPLPSDTLLHLAGVNANFRCWCSNERWCKRTFQQTTREALQDRKYKKRGCDNSASLMKQSSRGGERWNISHTCSGEGKNEGGGQLMSLVLLFCEVVPVVWFTFTQHF